MGYLEKGAAGDDIVWEVQQGVIATNQQSKGMTLAT